jgi:hypothetical protein
MAEARSTPSFDTIRYEVADAIATITLDRPDALNALTVPLKQELLAAVGCVTAELGGGLGGDDPRGDQRHAIRAWRPPMSA